MLGVGAKQGTVDYRKLCSCVPLLLQLSLTLFELF